MVRHVAGIAEIVKDVDAAARFYRDVLGLEVEHEPGAAYGTVKVDGILHFGLWSHAAAAGAAFGDESATDRVQLGFSIGFEVDAVDEASQQMESGGWELAQAPKTEPWGQKTSRFFALSGALCEISETPWARRIVQPMSAEGES